MFRIVALIVFAMFLVPDPSYAKPLKACLKSDSGKVRIKKRCKKSKGQVQLSAEILQGLGATQVGPAGPAGAQGVAGPQGPQGIQGVPGIADVFLDFESSSVGSVPAGGNITLTSNPCPAGSVLVSGGCSSNNIDLTLVGSHTVSLEVWECSWKNNSANSEFAILRAKAICVEFNE